MLSRLSSLWDLYNDTIEETIDYLDQDMPARRSALLKVRLYRPFCAEALIDAIPAYC